MSPLDRPVWSSLISYHAVLSEGGELARRFARDINLFASARDDSAEAAAALAALVNPEESIYVLQVPTIAIPAINGPSITSSGRSCCCLASSVSSSM